MGVSKPPSKYKTHVFIVMEMNFWHWRRTHFALGTNTSTLERNSLKTRIRTSATHKQLATSNFQTECGDDHYLAPKMVFYSFLSTLYPQVIYTVQSSHTCTHLRKWAVSHSSTHLKVCYTHNLYICCRVLSRENLKLGDLRAGFRGGIW